MDRGDLQSGDVEAAERLDPLDRFTRAVDDQAYDERLAAGERIMRLVHHADELVKTQRVAFAGAAAGDHAMRALPDNKVHLFAQRRENQISVPVKWHRGWRQDAIEY